MRIVDINSDHTTAEFAERATKAFAEDASIYTWAEGDPKPGELFAVRWNRMAIIVIRISGEDEVLNFPSHQFIGDDLPPLSRPAYA